MFRWRESDCIAAQANDIRFSAGTEENDRQENMRQRRPTGSAFAWRDHCLAAVNAEAVYSPSAAETLVPAERRGASPACAVRFERAVCMRSDDRYGYEKSITYFQRDSLCQSV